MVKGWAELAELEVLYPKLGDLFKQKFSGWNAYLFTADLRMPKIHSPVCFAQNTIVQWRD